MTKFRLVVEIWKTHWHQPTFRALQRKYRPEADEVEINFRTWEELQAFLIANHEESMFCRWYEEIAEEDVEWHPAYRCVSRLSSCEALTAPVELDWVRVGF